MKHGKPVKMLKLANQIAIANNFGLMEASGKGKAVSLTTRLGQKANKLNVSDMKMRFRNMQMCLKSFHDQRKVGWDTVPSFDKNVLFFEQFHENLSVFLCHLPGGEGIPER